MEFKLYKTYNEIGLAMEENFVKDIHVHFDKLVEIYGFKIKAELNDGNSYMIEYSSKDFAIRVEKYFKEFYLTVYSVNEPDTEINLFNLLEYINLGKLIVPKSKFFSGERSLDECFKKQFEYLYSVFIDNYFEINYFFKTDKYESNIVKLKQYWKDKYG